MNMTVRELLALPVELISSGFDALGIIFNAILDLDILTAGLGLSLLISIYLLYIAVRSLGNYRDKIMINLKMPKALKLIVLFIFNDIFLWFGALIILMFVLILFEMKVLPYI